ncbi:MAG: UDP-N-acetylmuramoyl-L-alanyl-D-glutamate--2,6-diaminopimelate ligase [Synergistaceae bacterium]|nr:UDP-N-acetylmuramoyl-L-alanyl-D-glutamate--2,6-diaminopimelate ligase [Synergistaceae bacterium]
MTLDELYVKMVGLAAGDATPTRILKRGRDSIDVSAVRYDSARIEAGAGIIFACVRGERVDGHDFAGRALESGAAALICDRVLSLDIPQIVTKNVRAAMGIAEAILRGNPANKLKMIGLTGTNGKTTTSYVIRSIIRSAGIRAGMLGTVVYDCGGVEMEAARTTPEGPDIQDMLAEMTSAGVEYCIMEASSHGLEQGRLAGCSFDSVGFSNLTPEHLEFHRDIEGYFKAKRRLFTDFTADNWVGAASADDRYGRRLLTEFKRLRPFTISAVMAQEFTGAYTASIESADMMGLFLKVSFPGGETTTVSAPLLGNYNASNIIEAIAITDSIGIDRDSIIQGVSNCPQVPGRLERYAFENGVNVFVDYAHSSDGMEKILSLLSSLKEKNLMVLWGAGGDRAPLKRPVVGALMARYADYIVVSTDNPRSERPDAIAEQVEAGIISSGTSVEYKVILDRGEAIRHILDRAACGDIVVVAGKGPERYIDYGTHKVQFSDNDTILEWARERGLRVADS